MALVVVLAGCGRFRFDPVGGGDDTSGDGGTVDAPTGPPMTFAHVASFAVGSSHTCAVRDDGTVWCWGSANFGQLGNGASPIDVKVPQQVPALASPAAAVYAGSGHTCVVLEDGGLWCWGNDFLAAFTSMRPLGWSETPTEIVGLAAAVKQVAIGESHICVLTTDKQLWCWGLNNSGQLGHGGTATELQPRVVTGVSNVAGVAAGRGHTCAWTEAGAIYCWGSNTNGQVTSPIGTNVLTPALIAVTGVVEAVAGESHTCARTGLGVSCWGNDSNGQLGDDASTNRTAPMQIAGLTDASQLAAGDDFTCAIRSAGEPSCWGGNEWGQLGDGTDVVRRHPGPTSLSAATQMRTSAGSYTTCVMTPSDALWCWGNNSNGQIGTSSAAYENVPKPSMLSGVDVAMGYGYTCARSSAGAVSCVGLNDVGQLGIGSPIGTITPTAVTLAAPAMALGAGGDSSAAAMGSTGLAVWGHNDLGQLGIGLTGDKPSPATNTLTNVVQIAMTDDHTCARTSAGSVWCWGQNDFGELGDNSTTQRTMPVQVTDLGTTAVDVCVGFNHSFAVDTSGGLWSWGDNTNGVLGDTASGRKRPAAVTTLPATVAQVACESSHGCARLTTGDVWCWGYNENGEHGDGTTGGASAPTRTMLPSTAVDISLTQTGGCAVLDDGRVFCGGSGAVVATDTYTGMPTEVPGLGGAVEVSTWSYHACAKLGDGSWSCWGTNNYGELGLGYRGHALLPVQPWLPAP
jgi:alpha-tubulin suppressor-like RCC1 family protein